MNRDQRDALDLVLAGSRRVDAVFARLAADVGRVLRVASLPLDRRRIMAQIDRLLDRTFGLTQRAALFSELFGAILAATDEASSRPYLRVLQRIERAMMAREPALWRRIRPLLLDDIGLGPRVWALPDLDRTDPEEWSRLVRLLRQQSAGERLFRSRLLDPQRRWVDGDGYRLSDRIWRQGRGVRRAIDARLRLAIRNGEDPIRVARDLERFLNPEWQPLRTIGGRIIVDERKGVFSLKPRGGHGSNAARRLARTEIMRAHGQAVIRSAGDVPGVLGVRWMLSNAHVHPDPCDEKARRSSRGLPPGVYTPREVPQYPTHPNEMCVLSHEMMPRAEVVDLIVQRYGGV